MFLQLQLQKRNKTKRIKITTTTTLNQRVSNRMTVKKQKRLLTRLLRNKITIKEDIKLKVQLKQLQLSNQSQKSPLRNLRKITTLQNKAQPNRKSKRHRPTKLSRGRGRRERRSKLIQRKASNRKGHKSKEEHSAKNCPRKLLRSLLTH